MDMKQEWLTRAEGVLKMAGFSDFFVKEIPNEYCGPNGCHICAQHPWLLVATPLGIFKFGWRKRVMVINWEKTTIAARADDLFKSEDTTKYDRLIHACSYAKAAEYFEALRKSAQVARAA